MKRTQVGRSVDVSLRDRIAATLKSRWPAPWFGGDRQHQQILDLADAVIAELDLGIPCAATGCRMRQLARRHTEVKLTPTDNFTCCGEQPVGEYPELPTELFPEGLSQ